MASPSRLLLAVFPTVLFAVALGTGASCGNTTDSYPALDGGVGGGITSGSTSGTGGTTGSSTSATSTGGGTTTTNTCAGAPSCTTVADCPTVGTSCLVNSCEKGCCSVSKAAPSTVCTDNGGQLCDGSGHCVACLTAAQCTAPTGGCAAAACTANACTTTNASKGTGCGDAGTTCDGKGNCVNAICTDETADGQETDVDCGGPVCSPCADTLKCKVGTDCVDKVCTGADAGGEGTCSAPTCSDGAQNGAETDVDCGGPTCNPCTNGEKCQKNADCGSGSCQSNVCVAASCSDTLQDGTETDVDCGGASCPACADGRACGSGANAGNNCTSKICAGGVCQVPTCTDGVQNGNETDIDCGGGGYKGASPCSTCNPGERCVGPSDCAGNNCQGGTCQCPQGMLVIPIQGGGIYCVDAIEVTNQQYNGFYTANPTTASQDAKCSWNVSWTPNGPWALDNIGGPVRWVNWCQAAAYCKYMGRRLCGKIGGGSVPLSSAADFTQDQWFNACSAQGVNCPESPATGVCYPYGTGYSKNTCLGTDNGANQGSPQPAPNLQSCQGGEIGIFDMSGNVAEWEDSCSANTGQNDQCAVRGGSYLGGSTDLRCDAAPTTGANGAITRKYSGPDVGFRCCL